MIEIAAAISIASSAYSGIKRAMDAGREAQDLASSFGKFFDAKDNILKASQDSQNQPLVKKLLTGTSVEAQAIETTAAKHKIMQLEKELREYLIYSGQGAFYEDMMTERRRIQGIRLRQAKEAAEKKKFMIDMFTIGGLVVATIVLIVVVIGGAMTLSE
jgi:hypothetical protein